MPETRVGYIGIDHHHRDPYLEIAGRLPVEVTCVCEPGTDYSLDEVRPMADRPDEVTSEDADLGAVLEGASVYSDPAVLLAEGEIDVAWITYRNADVPGIIDAAIERGVDVIGEKPLARTAADLAPVAERAREAGVTVGATYFYRWNPVAKELRGLVADGTFGDVWSVDGRYVGSKLAYRDTSHYIYDAAASRGGVLQWLGVHWIDLFMDILDDPIARVSATARAADIADVEAGMTLQFETRGGIAGTFQTGYYLGRRGKDTRFGVYGTDAVAETPLHHDPRGGGAAVPLSIASDHPDLAGAPRTTTEYELGYERFPAWGDYVLDFFADFFEGRATGDVPADVDDALRVLRVLDAAYESADRGGWVEV